jgi:hypothetical protein
VTALAPGRRTAGAAGPALRWLAALAVVVALLLLAPPARAAGDQGNRSIPRYDATYVLTPDGGADVTLDFDFDFADAPGHGPYLTLPIRQEIEGDDEHLRAYPVSGVAAQSPSGAPADVYLTETDDWLEIRIGDEAIGDVSGVHRYVVTYRVDGVVNPGAGAAGEDEFFWNVIGAEWVIPLRDVGVVVDGPGTVTDTICFAGWAGSQDPCSATSFTASQARFEQAALAAGQQLTIDVAFPAGTFPDAAPILVEPPPSPFELTPWTGGTAVLLAAAGSAYVIGRSGRRGRDQAYLGLTPGLAPAPGQEARVGHVRRAGPIAVQFTPPPEVRAGEVGTLVDEVADPKDVTATIIDLAVRGYLRIEEVEPPGRWGRGGDWNLRFVGGPDAGLKAYERELLDSLFATSLVVSLAGIKTTFASAMGRVQADLYDEVMAQRWFSANPKRVRSRWTVAGGAVLVAGGVLAFALAPLGWALAGVGLAVVGIVTMAVAKRAPARTAAGTAVLAQTLGFKRYLETAEANQLRFEEGEDLFSRYLPFAIVFGVAERWAGIFEQLARQGRAVAEPTWYVGPSYHPGYFWLGASHFGSTMESFSTIATASIAAPTPGSSGGSGFGGGGSAGGGGGGGGGGGW